MKEFFSSFFSSANIIARAKVPNRLWFSTFALAGRGMALRLTQGNASLALG